MSDRLKDGLIALTLFIVALGERFFFLHASLDKSSVFSVFYYGDAVYHSDQAHCLLKGQIFNHGLPFQPPLFSYVLYMLYVLGGSGVSTVLLKMLLAVLNSACVSFLYLLGKRSFGRTAALLAALMASFSFSQFVLCSSLNIECLFQFLLFSLMLLLISEKGKWNITTLIIAGFLAGFAALSSPDFLSFLPLLGGGIYLGLSSTRAVKAAAVILVLFAAAVVIVPWALRNYQMIGLYNENYQGEPLEPLSRFAPVVDTGPIDFLSVNNNLSNGEFSRTYISGNNAGYLIPVDGFFERYQFNHGYREGWRFIKNHPARALSLAAKKLGVFMRAFSLGFGKENAPLGLKGVRRPADMFAPDPTWFLYIQLVLFIGGFWLYWLRADREPLIFLLFLHSVWNTVLYFGFVKRGAVLMPLAYLFVSYFLVYLFRKFRLPGLFKNGTVRTIAWLIPLCALFCWEAVRSRDALEMVLRGTMNVKGSELIQENKVWIAPLKAGKEKKQPKGETWQKLASSFTRNASSTIRDPSIPRDRRGLRLFTMCFSKTDSSTGSSA